MTRADADLQALIPGYLAKRHRDVQTMREALEQCDYATIQLLAHRMRGSGGGYGFDAITEIGSALEQAAIRKSPDDIRGRVGELLTYLQTVSPSQ